MVREISFWESWIYRTFLTVASATASSARRLEMSDTFSFNKYQFPKPCSGLY